MTDRKIDAQLIIVPVLAAAAWLTGFIVTSGSFWERFIVANLAISCVFVLASIVNVLRIGR